VTIQGQFYEELGQVFYNSPKHHTKIPLEDLKA